VEYRNEFLKRSCMNTQNTKGKNEFEKKLEKNNSGKNGK